VTGRRRGSRAAALWSRYAGAGTTAQVGVVAAEDSGVSAVPGHLRKNLTGVTVNADEFLLRVLGFAREETVGPRSTEFLHPDDHEQAFSSWVRSSDDPQPAAPKCRRIRIPGALHAGADH
jgi:hypothetical protein